MQSSTMNINWRIDIPTIINAYYFGMKQNFTLKINKSTYRKVIFINID